MTRFGLVLLAAALLAPAATADSWDDYRAGVAALESGDNATAVRLLQRAIAEKPEESATVFRRYLPHFQLGLAQAAVGDCRGAIASFAESQRQGKSSREREAEQMKAPRARCEATVKQGDELAARVREELDGARAALETLDGLGRAPIMRSAWREGKPSFAERQAQATAKVGGFRDSLQSSQRLPDIEALEALVVEAKAQREAIVAVRREAQRVFDEVRSAADARQAEVETLVATATRDLGFVKGLGVGSPRLNESMRRVEAAIAALREVEASTPAEQVLAASEAVKREMATLRREARQPPDELRSIAEAVLGARYADALARLDKATFAEPRAEAQACLLRSAATWGRDVVAGVGAEPSRALLEGCFATLPMPRLVEAAFPPGFVSLVREVEAARAAR